MYTTRVLHHDSSPTPDAYDGLWLEVLENPDAAPPSWDSDGGDGAGHDLPPGAAGAGA